MMTSILSMMVALSSSSILKSSNPVKTSVMILLMGVIMFFSMALMTNKLWIPTLMTMLFMGGIVMMFMILSSILPNEKSIKSTGNVMIFLASMILYPIMKMGLEESTELESKGFLSSGSNFMMMTILILIYFLMSVGMLTSEEAPMRVIT